MNEYRVQRLKEDLTYAQQRNKQQKKQLANYKKVHEKDLIEIERLNKRVKECEEAYLRTRHLYSELENKYLTDEYIINELEKYIIEYSQDLEFRCYANTFLDKLRELKGDSSNE